MTKAELIETAPIGPCVRRLALSFLRPPGHAGSIPAVPVEAVFAAKSPGSRIRTQRRAGRCPSDVLRLTLSLATVLLGPAEPLKADEVYKCTAGGETSYRSSADSPDCQPLELYVPQPSPEDLERLAREREQRERDQAQADEQSRQERLVRAKELEALAAERRARAAEAQTRLLKEQQQRTTFPYTYYAYPNWGTEMGGSARHPHYRPLQQPEGVPQPPIEPEEPDENTPPVPGFSFRIK